jgi:nitroimidazol reductase NimA-like FMN-containing flavoprotein (pyridoxamine 5'-phosphate oxidase superfamily)
MSLPGVVVTVTPPADPPRDHAGLAVLGYEECLRLAASEPVGRLALADGGDIHIFPVNHCVLDGLVAFCTADGTKLGAAMEGSVVAFEVDRYDADKRTGWSVLVKGRAEIVTDSSLRMRLRATGLRPWRGRIQHPEWVVIRPDTVTGRRL